MFHRLKDEDDPLLAQRLAEGVLEQQRRAGKITSTMQLAVPFATSWAVARARQRWLEPSYPCVPSRPS